MKQSLIIEIIGLLLFFSPLFWMVIKIGSEWWQAVLVVSIMLCGFRIYLYKKMDKTEREMR